MRLVIARRSLQRMSRLVETSNGSAVVTESLLGAEEIHFAPQGTAEARTRRDLEKTMMLAGLCRLPL